MKNFRKSKKALSPVVASIILIAVTVAVSIAVAAWMGALSFGFMQTEEIRITNVQFTESNAEVTAINTGSSNVVIIAAYEGNNYESVDPSITITPGEAASFSIPGEYSSGTSYQFKLESARGNVFVYTATAPT
jgi:archaeal type IV pilus assembly protein PilA